MWVGTKWLCPRSLCTELAPIHLRWGGGGQLRVLGGGQEGRKGWVRATYNNWWVSEVDVGHP